MSAKTVRSKKKRAPVKKQKVWDPRLKLVLGLILVFIAFFFILSFISYFFTWQSDQSFLDMSWSKALANPDIQADNWAGKAGALVSNLFIYRWFGGASLFLAILVAIYGLVLMSIRTVPIWKTTKYVLFGVIWFSVTLGYVFHSGSFLWGGGHGLFLSDCLSSFLGNARTLISILVTGLIYLVFLFRITPDMIRARRNRTSVSEFFDENNHAETPPPDTSFSKQINETDQVSVEFDPEMTVTNTTGDKEEIASGTTAPPFKDYDPTRDLSHYRLPGISLLKDHSKGHPKVSDEELIGNKNRIVETLGNYNIRIEKIKATIGPTITLYEIIPAPGIRISKIKNLEDDIALSLSALGIRIIAPIPGRGTIGIEVPNRKPEIVSMSTVLSSKRFQENNYELPVALGKTISNETYTFDLARLPHLLVAGATGQGKSVGINAIITSLLFKKHPAQIKFVMIDPKKVELTLYAKIEKHYLAKLPDYDDPIITDNQHVIQVLHSLSTEMDERYNLLKRAEVRNIKEYNDKFVKRRLNPANGHRFLPYLILVIDEFADLIMTSGKEIELPLTRIAQLARAVGIHMLIATQRPSTNIITGTIKANFPARIAFRVPSMIDSRTILDSPGANHLVGRGDMLVSMDGNLVRVQCAFIDTQEVETVTRFISGQTGYPQAWELPEPKTETSDESANLTMDKTDDLFEEAARLLVTTQQGSTSSIQRKFSIGYNRAGRIMDQLESAGIVGPADGSKPRQVLYQDLYSLEKHLNEKFNP